MSTLRVAVQGCAHGELDRIYASLIELQSKAADQRPVDLLICCGDFQAVRNEPDLECMACPPKYRAMRDFWKYYAGLAVAPVLTIVVGGNHEASNYMQELPYGGWLAPNIYYLGTSGVVRYRGLRVAGYSGIFKRYDWGSGFYEVAPYNDDALHSVNHTRHFDLWRLSQLSQPVDIMMSHDWPAGITGYGDQHALIRHKRHFEEDIARGELGNPHAMDLLRRVQPRYWFAGHLHCRFAAVVSHGQESGSAGSSGPAAGAAADGSAGAGSSATGGQQQQYQSRWGNAGSSSAPMVPPSSSAAAAGSSGPSSSSPSSSCPCTRFLATDKPLPGRAFLQVLDIPVRQAGASEEDGSLAAASGAAQGSSADQPSSSAAGSQKPPQLQACLLEFDPEWMAVLASCHAMLPTGRKAPYTPSLSHGRRPPPITPEQQAEVMQRLAAVFGSTGQDNSSGSSSGQAVVIPRVAIPFSFVQNVPPWVPPPQAMARGPSNWYRPGPPPPALGNPQMDTLLGALGLPHVHTIPCTHMQGPGGPAGSSGSGAPEQLGAGASWAGPAPPLPGFSGQDAAAHTSIAPTQSTSASVAQVLEPQAVHAGAKDPSEIDLDDI